MDSFFTRLRNPLTLIAIVIAQVLALAIQVQTVQRPSTAATSTGPAETHHVTLLRHWLLAVVTPFERLSHASGSSVRSLWSNYIDLRHTREHDRELQTEIARLRTEQAEFAEDAREGRRLEALLAFKQQYIAQTVAAQVIGTSGSDRSRLLTLDKGYADGLRTDQPVMTPDGIVGKLRDVSAHTAELQLLSDPNSGAGVLLSDLRIRGILRGTADGRVEVNNLTADSRLQPGQAVITSGGDQVFPRGLPVGVIESIAPDPIHQPYTAILIKPAANLSRLEEVLVITATQAALPAAAQTDAAQADTTAEANKRAADLVAERLPSIHDDQNSDATPAAPRLDATGSPIVEIPKPKPAAHPDRYSPGAAPPADELQPGAAAPKSDTDSNAGESLSQMPEHSYTSRRELDQYAFHPAVSLLVPLVCLILQALLPKIFPRLAILDLPLLAVIFFAFARRSPIKGAVTGTFIGLFQDGVSGNHFGIFGISKAIVGYIAASIGFAVDMDNAVNRGVLTFAFSLLQSAILFVIMRGLLGDHTWRLLPLHSFPLHELLRAVFNTVVAIPLYFLLDRFKYRE